MDIEKYFLITIRAMRITGCHPDTIRNKKWLFRIIIEQFLLSIVFSLFVYSLFAHDIHSKEFARVCQSGSMASLYMLCFQYIIIINNSTNVADLLDIMKNDFERVRHLNPQQKKIVVQRARRGMFIERIWSFLMLLFCLAFPTKTVYFYLRNLFIGKFEYIPLQALSYPPFIEDRKDDLWMYLLLYALNLYYVWYSNVIYVAFVQLAPILMLHASGQLELLTIRVGNLFVDRSDEEVYEELKDIAKQLQIIYRFVDAINDIFKITSNINMKVTTFVSPFIVKALGVAQSMEFLGFVIGSFAYNFLLCYCGEMIIEQGERFRISLYTCGWEKHYDKRTRTFLLLLQIRALSPVAAQIVFENMCLETLAGLWQQAYSIFNLINAVWD